MKKYEGDFTEKMIYLQHVLIQAHEYHLRHGVEGCDPRLFWYFPAYKFSLRKKSGSRAFLRKTESLFIRLFPEAIRPYQRLCKIPDVVSPYGLALFVQAYCKIYKINKEEKFLAIALERASSLIEKLVLTKSGNLGVTNPLEDENNINLPAGSEAVYALVELYDITLDERYLSVAARITDSFNADFSKKRDERGNICLDYTVGMDGSYVLNANALAAGAMTQVAERLKSKKYDDLIVSIVDYVIPYIFDARNIPYSGIEDLTGGKIYDVYHTGFTLRGIFSCMPKLSGNVNSIKDAIYAKLSKMRLDFLDKNGLIRLSQTRRIIDIHGVAEYIRCLSEIDYCKDDVEVFLENIKFMHKNGRFYYQRGIRDIDIYMPRWGHAPMMLAIAELMLKIRSNE